MPSVDVSLKDLVRDIPDFPKAGVAFKDITPLLGDAEGYALLVEAIAASASGRGVTKVVGIEARGFIVAAPVAYRLGAGFVPVRKTGKLPWRVEAEGYALEYGTDLLEIHADAISPGERVVIVDDVLATGGTAAATVRLVERLGGVVAGLAFIVELGFLGGRSQLTGHHLTSLLTYE
ncbi:MAG: adenine phosphoribosyltransferase [Acidimicrobiia bacterium]